MPGETPNFPDSEESFESQDIAEPSNSKSGVKRRASRAGTRSVASLTPEQLVRKRANDREAQRSIRQRTKNHIEDLERRIRELSGEEESQILEDVRRRNAELEEELRHLKDTLGVSEGSVASSPELAPLSTRYGMDIIDSPYSYSPQWLSSPAPSSPSSMPFTTSSAGELISSLAPHYSSLGHGFSDPSSTRSDNFSPSHGVADITSIPPQVASPINRRGMPFNTRPQFGRSRSYPNGRLGQPFPTVSSAMLSSQINGAMSAMSQPSLMSHTIAPTSNLSGLNGSMMGMGSQPPPSHAIAPNSNSLGMIGGMADIASSMPSQVPPALVMNGMASPIPIHAHPALGANANISEAVPLMPTQVQDAAYDIPSSFVNQPPLHIWELPLRLLPATGPVDSIMIGLLQRQRNLALEGKAGAALTGPYHANCRGLLDLEDSASTHPVSSVLANLLRRTQLKSLTEKAAAMYIIYRFTQWQISPSPETYDNLPEWYGPRASQFMTGHPFWSTLIVWGKLRDVVINAQEQYATEEFQHLYTCSINVNWPYPDQNIFVFEGEEVRITDAFESHVRTQANWSLDEPFQRRYPELGHACGFIELPM